MSETVRLRNEDSDISPYRSLSEPLLYYDGHIQLDVPIKVDGVTVQVSAKCIIGNFLYWIKCVYLLLKCL